MKKSKFILVQNITQVSGTTPVLDPSLVPTHSYLVSLLSEILSFEVNCDFRITFFYGL